MKALIFPFLVTLAVCAASALGSSRVKKVEVQKDQIVHVNTAMGIATIIQVPDRPNSVVVGDQDAFKVEYLDLAITIKPIAAHGKSNLYIYTDYRRFNVELATGPESSADYVVYLDNPKDKEDKKPFHKNGSAVSWNKISKSFRNETTTFTVSRVGALKNGVVIIEFTLSSSKKENVNPAWFWVTQGGVTRPIQNLFMSDVKLSPGQTIQGSIQLLKSDLTGSAPLRIEMRRKKTTHLTLREVSL
jgi:hypothetical protein